MIGIKLNDILKFKFTDKSKKQLEISNEKEIKNEIKDYTSIYRRSDFISDSLYIGNTRERAMTENMDNVLSGIKDECFKLPLLARAILNITSKSSDKVFYFSGKDSDKTKKVAKKFIQILKNSNYNPHLFLKEAFQNLVKYSNVFIMPIKDEENKLIRLRIMPNKGWTVHSKIGTFLCTEFKFADTFSINDGIFKDKIFKNKIEIFHYTYGKESDEIFAMPIWCSVIPLIKKYNFLTNNALQSYADQAITRIIYEMGINKAGAQKPIRPDQYNSAKNLLKNTDDDLIVDFPINPNKVEKNFNSPDKLLEVLELQIYSGLYTSKGQLGASSSGRQDAETQNENTINITNSFFKELEYQINRTIIDEICLNEFGNLNDEIELKFSEGFNIQERKEKHAVFLFQGGIITIDEARDMCNRKTVDFDIEETFHGLYNEKMSGIVENTNNPKNQHTSGTGTTKKTNKN